MAYCFQKCGSWLHNSYDRTLEPLDSVSQVKKVVKQGGWR